VRIFIIKINLCPSGTPKSLQNIFLLQQDHTFGDFGVRDECKFNLIITNLTIYSTW